FHDRVRANIFHGLGLLCPPSRAKRLKPALLGKRHDPALARPGLHLTREVLGQILRSTFEEMQLDESWSEFHKTRLLLERILKLDVPDLARIGHNLFKRAEMLRRGILTRGGRFLSEGCCNRLRGLPRRSRRLSPRDP